MDLAVSMVSSTASPTPTLRTKTAVCQCHYQCHRMITSDASYSPTVIVYSLQCLLRYPKHLTLQCDPAVKGLQ